ncbi:unnamed protein product [Paramecium octaurelia]|uniref:Uncharacterized protein n=1 Tax=Paramecium octaurelia TaxID=43137 RepID=A0A8S1W6M7_PAROT|nr:unnamed protein product [Paramecium octaurelia]
MNHFYINQSWNLQAYLKSPNHPIYQNVVTISIVSVNTFRFLEILT